MKGSILTNATSPDRNSTDFYPTPSNVTIALMRYLDIRGKTVWEPACGNGMMAETLVNCVGVGVHWGSSLGLPALVIGSSLPRLHDGRQW